MVCAIIVLLSVKAVTMSDSFHGPEVPHDMKLNPVVARPQTIPTGQFAAQRLRSAHAGPLLKLHQQLEHPAVNGIAQLFQSVRRYRGQYNRGHVDILLRIDVNVNSQRWIDVRLATRAARERLLDVAVSNVKAFLAGTPQNVVNLRS